MKINGLYFFIFLFICSTPLFAQTQHRDTAKTSATSNIRIDEPVNQSPSAATNSSSTNLVFSAVEKQPEFPGGIPAFYTFVKTNLKKTATPAKGHVYITFIVEKDGSLSDIKVIRGLSPECDTEALRVIANSPKWVPGVQNGYKVRVSYTVPVVFN